MNIGGKNNSYIKAVRATLGYGAIGVIWINGWNVLVAKISIDINSYIRLQGYKEWFYLIITMGIIYLLVQRDNNSWERLKDNHDELVRRDERYKLIIEGSRDGIWDWDLVNNIFYSSLKYKEGFGYKKGEIDHSYDAWIDLIHKDDVESEQEGISDYIISQQGIYENTYRVKSSDGSYRWVLSKAKAMWDDEGYPTRIAGSHTDITDQKEMEDQVYSLAYYNVLTGMPNRSKFNEKVNQKIIKYANTMDRFAIIYMNADNLRRINDTWGYEVGDELLKYISRVISSFSKEFFLCAHLGGDEFAIIMDKIGGRAEIISLIDKLLNEFKSPWKFENHKTFVTFSIGIVLYPEHGESLYSLVVNADAAMKHVKDHGKDGYSFYTKDIQTKRVAYIQTAHQIREALKNSEFTVHYQPQINLVNGEIAGMEALIRWEHPEKGVISPDEFIPLAEATGEIHSIGRFVLKTVCKQKRKWAEKGYPEVIVSVNISGISLTRGDLAEEIKELLERYQVDGAGIRIEVTETAIMNDMDMAIITLEKIKELGIKVALDDFGTGYSSLTYLQKLPIDVVKIDREFIKNIKNKDEKEIIVEIVIRIAEALGLEVVAEGIETKEQLSYVINSKCEQAQGYLFSRPMAPEQIEQILVKGFKYQI